MSWHGFKPNKPDWSSTSKSLAVYYIANPQTSDHDLYIMFNADSRGHSFTLPKLPVNKLWYRVLNTSHDSPDDIVQPGFEVELKMQKNYRLAPYSVVLLMGK